MIVLGLSTSTPRGSVAVADGAGIRAQASYVELKAHGERLFELIDQVCSSAGLRKEEIQAIGCDVGPGSFTGVRVAVAAAHGIAMALGVPTVGVSSLEAMAVAAFRGHPSASRVMAVLDAYKGECFVGVFEQHGAGEARALESFVHASREAVVQMLLAAQVDQRTLVVGQVLASLLPAATSQSTPEAELPHAAMIASLSRSRLVAGDLPREGLVPVYVRAPDAKPQASGRPIV